MRTLSSAVASAVSASSSEPVYVVAFRKIEGTTDPDGNADEWPSGVGTTKSPDSYRYFSTGRVGWSDRAAAIASYALDEDRLGRDSLKDVIYKVGDGHGGLAPDASFSLFLNNTDGHIIGSPSARYLGVEFEGRRCELRLNFSTQAASASDVYLFRGTVSDVRLRGDKIEVLVDSVHREYDRDLPITTISSEVLSDGSYYPAASRGLLVPLVFGDHDAAPMVKTRDVYKTGGVDYGALYVAADINAGLVHTVSRVQLGDVGLLEASKGFARLNELPGKSPYTVSASEGGFYLDDKPSESGLLYVYVRVVGMIKDWYSYLTYSGSESETEPYKAIDGDDATYANLELWSGETNIVYAWKPPPITLDADLEMIRIFGLFYKATGLTFLKSYVGFDLDEDTDGVTSLPADRFELAAGTTDIDIGDIGGEISSPVLSTFSELGRSYLFLTCAGGSTASYYARCYTLRGFDIYGSLDIPEDGFYCDMMGYKDLAGYVTGTTNQLIESPPHIISYIYMFLSGAASNFDYFGFRDLGNNERSGWDFARSITDKTKLSAVVDGIASESLMWVWVDGQASVTAFPMAASSSPAHEITPGDIARGRIDKYDRSPIDEVVTEFVFRFNYNHIRDEFDETLECSRSGSSEDLGSTYEDLCAWARYRNGQKDRRRVFDLSWVRDRDTAILVAKKLIVFYASRRWEVQFTGDLILLKYEIGDEITFSVGDWPPAYPSDMLNTTYRITENRHRPKTDTITITAREVFE